MAGTLGENIEILIAQAQQVLADVYIIRQDADESRSLINLEGRWGDYRIIAQEIHRADGSMRYSYYILDKNNRLVYGFDNSPDKSAIQLYYGVNWQVHQSEEIPHQHDANHKVTLTTVPMTFETFVKWLVSNLAE
jgi:hypothetical protein